MKFNFVQVFIFSLCFLFIYPHIGAYGEQVISFKLYDSETSEILANTKVSIYDGFDRTLSYVPTEPDNRPYHFADMMTDDKGIIKLDLLQLKENMILITTGKYYKYIGLTNYSTGRRDNSTVMITRYKREGYSLRVTSLYIYNLNTKILSIKNLPSEKFEKTETFSYINVPMDY